MNLLNHSWIKKVLLLVAIIIIMTGLRLSWFIYHHPSQEIQVTQNTLVLSESNLLAEKPLTLDNGWIFYPNVILTSLAEIKTSNVKPLLVNNPAKPMPYEVGTYRLRLALPSDTFYTEPLSIRIPASKTASSLYINGKLKNQSGTVSNRAKDHEGKGRPYVINFTPITPEIDLLIPVSNFDTSEGVSIHFPIKFGTTYTLEAHNASNMTFLISLLILLVLHSLYSFLIYLFINRNKKFLIYSIGFLLPALDELLVYNSSFADSLFFDYDVIYKFQTLVYLGAAYFLVFLIRDLLKKHHDSKIFLWINYTYITLIGAIVLLPLSILANIDDYFFFAYLSSFMVVLTFSIREFFDKREDSFLLALIVISTTSGIFWGLIKALYSLEIPFYPFDYMTAFLAFAFLWFNRFFIQNKALQTVTNDLKEMDRKRDEFIAITAHEIKNPLYAISNIAVSNLSINQDTHFPRIRENSELILQISNRLSLLINDLIDFTQIKEDKIVLNKETTSLPNIARQVIDVVKFISENQDIEYKLEFPHDLPLIEVDINRITQVFFNLIYNAVKFSKYGRLDDKRITVTIKLSKQSLVTSIEDNGIGIRQDALKRIFEPYAKEATGHHPMRNGIGLGLSISKQLIELHNGQLYVTSSLGKGSIFTFTLPLTSKFDTEAPHLNLPVLTQENKKNHEIKSEISAGIVHDKNKSASLLIVDSDALSLNVLKTLLEDTHNVFVASNATEAYACLNQYSIDLVISDVILSDESGYSFTRNLRKRYSLSELPVLLLTRRSTPQDVYIGFQAGANDYVTKPIVALEFTSRVKVLIELKHSVKLQLQTEAAWLQAQIQPHFLFNTLNSIASLGTIDTTRMLKLLEEFSNFLRKSFDIQQSQSLIPLHQELELIKSYVYIEQQRFEGRLHVKWNIGEVEAEIPPLSIQPLVENAIKHGVLKQIQGGTVTINVIREGDFALIQIQDDGIGIKKEQIRNIFDFSTNGRKGIGIANTNRRLKEHFGSGLIIESDGSGTVVSFKVPINY